MYSKMFRSFAVAVLTGFFFLLVNPIEAADLEITSKVNHLQMRSNPNLNSEVVGSFTNNDKAVVVEISSFSVMIDGKNSPWFKIVNSDGHGGWVFGGYINPLSQEQLNWTLEEGIAGNEMENIKAAIAAGANVKIATDGVHLLQAIDVGNPDIVKTLLDNGADPNKEYCYEKDVCTTPLNKACLGRSLEIVRLLITAGAKLDPEIIPMVAWYGTSTPQKDLYQFLLTSGANPNAAFEGQTALTKIIDIEILKVLLNNGADVNLKAKSGWTPLMYAVYQNEKDKENLLRGAGAREDGLLDIKLLQAIEKKDLQGVKKLIQQGANPNATNSNGDHFLLVAGYTHQYDLFDYLIGLGLNVDTKGFKGRTALFWAVESGDFNFAKLLIQNGANPLIADEFGRTAMSIANSGSEKAMVKLLHSAKKPAKP